MENILEFMKTDLYLMILSGIVIILFIAFLINSIKVSKLKKKYTDFMKKIGNGRNLEEDLQRYMERVLQVEEKADDLINYCKTLDKDIVKCIQKIGIVRYSAFKDTGSDLSFALAMLDEKNNGVVLNGIYSREMSNIYAKPIEQGKSPNYTLSEQEIEAINKAMNSEETYKIR